VPNATDVGLPQWGFVLHGITLGTMAATLSPTTDLEQRLLETPELRTGLAWGSPRWGHPEGSVGAHAAALLALIGDEDPLRDDLRVLALLHDSFKAAVRPGERWSRDNDHAVLARRFAERFIRDERVLAALELHDEPYWIWRNAGAPADGLVPLLERIPDIELFARFVELDASTEGKNLSFLWWFRRELAIAGVLPAHPVAPPIEPGGDGQRLYVKTFSVDPADQAEVAAAARALVADHAAILEAQGEVFTSDDGLRVLLVWRWTGGDNGRLLRDGDVVRDALARHPIFSRVDGVDARVYLGS
jgi:hypothetical protein